MSIVPPAPADHSTPGTQDALLWMVSSSCGPHEKDGSGPMGWQRIVGGGKRGQVYGHGKVSSRLKPPVYDSEDIFTVSVPVDMQEQVTLLNHEPTQQAEEHREEVAALRRQLAADLKRLQSSLDT
ncbi:hypothetical protein PIB30_050561 [Stylosanthes scabra]|uniref:Uncharacterized protein n=1 Tax=Stylosanthes scabra TaxID=79078 RepID=A0ABU6RI95_9FABA|nr:hypothetical protein [Stylosanthes scabra]